MYKRMIYDHISESSTIYLSIKNLEKKTYSFIEYSLAQRNSFIIKYSHVLFDLVVELFKNKI